MEILVVWALNALALMMLPYLFTSIRVEGLATALITALLLGLVNALIRPLLILLTLPVTLLTLGFFILVINGLLFWCVASFVRGFSVGGFWSAFWGAIVYSIVSWGFTTLALGRKI